MTNSDDTYAGELLRLLRRRRFEGRHQGVVDIAQELLQATDDLAVLAEAFMAQANAFMWSEGDAGAAMTAAAEAVRHAEAAYAQQPDRADILVSALTLQAELQRQTGERTAAQEVVDRALVLAEGAPGLEAQAWISLGRLMIGDITPEQDPPEQMASLFYAAAEQLHDGPDALLYAWALVHNVFGLYCAGQVHAAQMAMRELTRLVEQGLAHTEILQAQAVLTGLMKELHQEGGAPSRVAALVPQLLRIIRII